MLLGWKWCRWVEEVVAILHTGGREPLMFPFSHQQFWTDIIKACQSLSLKIVTFEQARNSGLNIDHAVNVRPLSECRSRGQWRTDQSVQRYEKSARLAADYLALLRRTRDLIETFEPLAEGAILGTIQGSASTGVWTASTHNDVVVSRVRAYGVPYYSTSEDQTNLTLQRAYRVNQRRDIETRRIAGALLTPARGTDSLSKGCLDTCCFLAGQLHVAR